MTLDHSVLVRIQGGELTYDTLVVNEWRSLCLSGQQVRHQFDRPCISLAEGVNCQVLVLYSLRQSERSPLLHRRCLMR